eukprot:TRINITY_DN54549_c0_g1_i1.p1 TRINITY_DN54549_c0_g1~~TRINITY_DN54549_c0_g1_i1.p1  ORF type:complete len:379 (-),score=66.26 TRINITY_DN54549_c0_g1_i1:187-1323(-)
MANKKRKERSGSAVAAKPFGSVWYVAATVVAFIAVAVCWFLRSSSTSEAKSVSDSTDLGRSVADLEAQMRKLHTGLSAVVAGHGDSPVFKTIRDMADNAQSVLSAFEAAKTDEERRRILENGLSSKTDWLSSLTGRAKELDEESKADAQAHAPLTINPGGSVELLTRDSFTGFMLDNPRAMVEFFAPWCGHCKKFAPEYEKSARYFKGRAGFAAVDGTTETQLARVYKVGGYPTLKWFVKGRPIDYSGPRTAQGISKWVDERLQPAYQEIDAGDDLQTAVEASEDSAAICAGSGRKGSPSHAAFEYAAEYFRGKLLFLWTPPRTGDSGEDVILLYRRGRSTESCQSKVDDSEESVACSTPDHAIAWLSEALGISNADE